MRNGLDYLLWVQMHLIMIRKLNYEELGRRQQGAMLSFYLFSVQNKKVTFNNDDSKKQQKYPQLPRQPAADT